MAQMSAPECSRLSTAVSARTALCGAAATVVVCAVLLAATSPQLPMAWDEGNAIRRAEGIERWCGRWVSGPAAPGPLSAEAIAADWQYTTAVEGHPAGYGIVLAAGRWLSAAWLAPLESYRFGPILLFAVAAGAMFYRLAREHGLAAAVGGAVALVCLPRLFAHAHFASFDGPLTSLWVLTWAAFPWARGGWRPAIGWGAILGATLAMKFTGWLAPVAFVAWAVARRDRRACVALAIGLPVALVTFLALNPPLWHDPWGGWLRFMWLNTHRGADPGLNISTYFLGRMYNLDHPLPWYNTLVWTAVTVPVGLLWLAGVGLVTSLRSWRSRPELLLLVGHWAVLVIVRATPWAPPHDAERLFLPSFAMLAALAGVGCARVLQWAHVGRIANLPTASVSNPPGASAGRQPAPRGHVPSPDLDRRPTIVRRWLARSAVAAVLLSYAGGVASLVAYAPQWLSYYNLLVGGLPGATALGLEPTYYWDGLDRSVLAWLDEHTGEGEKVRFAAGPAENLRLMRRWGTLPVEYRREAPGEFRWYALQRRPSAWQPADRWLVAHGKPAYRKVIGRGGWGPWRLDVPLVEVYRYAEYERAQAAVARP